MPTTPTLTIKWRVNGTLADVTSVVLASPADVTPAYGVRRTDTAAVIVASGAAMTHAATGVYTWRHR